MTENIQEGEWVPLKYDSGFGSRGRIEMNSAGQVRIVDIKTGRIVGPDVEKVVPLRENVLKK